MTDEIGPITFSDPHHPPTTLRLTAMLLHGEAWREATEADVRAAGFIPAPPASESAEAKGSESEDGLPHATVNAIVNGWAARLREAQAKATAAESRVEDYQRRLEVEQRHVAMLKSDEREILEQLAQQRKRLAELADYLCDADGTPSTNPVAEAIRVMQLQGEMAVEANRRVAELEKELDLQRGKTRGAELVLVEFQRSCALVEERCYQLTKKLDAAELERDIAKKEHGGLVDAFVRREDNDLTVEEFDGMFHELLYQRDRSASQASEQPGDFGSDTKDSAELLALRKAIDKWLPFASDGARELGDYVGAVTHVGVTLRDLPWMRLRFTRDTSWPDGEPSEPKPVDPPDDSCHAWGWKAACGKCRRCLGEVRRVQTSPFPEVAQRSAEDWINCNCQAVDEPRGDSHGKGCPWRFPPDLTIGNAPSVLGMEEWALRCESSLLIDVGRNEWRRCALKRGHPGECVVKTALPVAPPSKPDHLAEARRALNNESLPGRAELAIHHLTEHLEALAPPDDRPVMLKELVTALRKIGATWESMRELAKELSAKGDK